MRANSPNNLLRVLPKVAAPLSLLAAAYLAFSPRGFQKIYSSRVFKPLPYPQGDWSPIESDGVRRQDVYFPSTDGVEVHGWFFHRPDSRFVIAISHGNTGNLTGRFPLAAMLLKTGASVLLYDYRGYGRSQGTPSLRGICDDGDAAVDFLLQEKGYRPEQIVLYGESLGCSVACAVAAERPCAGLIVQSGFTSLPEIGRVHLPFTCIYPKFFYPRPHLDNADLIAKVEHPVLIVHGHKDTVVPFSHALEIFRRAREPKTLVELPDCAHSDILTVAGDQYLAAVKSFLGTL
jgi:alpha-beta hydrolase superfamily lysophospholipase